MSGYARHGTMELRTGPGSMEQASPWVVDGMAYELMRKGMHEVSRITETSTSDRI